jgi:ribosomal protein S3
MGQKVLPFSLRLNKKKNWHSQWIVEKKDYSKILDFDLNIRKYIEKIFNKKKRTVLQIKINKISKNIYIYVFVYNFFKREIFFPREKIITCLKTFLNNRYNIKLFILKTHLSLNKYQKNLKFLIKNFKNKKNTKILKFLNICQIALTINKINIISKYISKTIKKKKIHTGYLKFLNNILKQIYKINPKLLGYKLQIKGRINKSKRKRKIIFQEGQIPLNSIDKNIQYAFDEFITKSGICSIKIWFFFKDIKKIKLNKIKKINGTFLNKNYKFFKNFDNNRKNYNNY